MDIICGILSALGIVLWLTTRIGNVAILFAILADGLAAIPTIIKSYKFPETESYLVYLLGFVNAVITLLIIRTWSFANFEFSVYILVVGTILVLLIKFKLGKLIQRRFS